MQYVENMTPEEFYKRIYSGIDDNICLGLCKKYIKEFENAPDSLVNEIKDYLDENIPGPGETMIIDEEMIKNLGYLDDIVKIQKDFSEFGFIISPVEAYCIWSARSDSCRSSRWEWVRILENQNAFIDVIEFGLIFPY